MIKDIGDTGLVGLLSPSVFLLNTDGLLVTLGDRAERGGECEKGSIVRRVKNLSLGVDFGLQGGVLLVELIGVVDQLLKVHQDFVSIGVRVLDHV